MRMLPPHPPLSERNILLPGQHRLLGLLCLRPMLGLMRPMHLMLGLLRLRLGLLRLLLFWLQA